MKFNPENPNEFFKEADIKEYISQLNKTSLPSHILFNEIVNKTISRAKRHNLIFAILIINFDNFDERVSNEMNQRFINILRTEDTLAKLEGDEFLILLNDIDQPKFAGVVAEKLLAACRQPITINSQEAALSANIGICIYPTDGGSLEDLLKNAEHALHKAKSDKINTYHFYTQQMNIEAREYIKIQSALRDAIKQDELELYYQPKLHLKKGIISGVEALLRWTHPERGIINPTTLIQIAEESGLIIQLGEWTLRQACKTNKHWQQEGYEHMSVSVNLSTRQFRHPNIIPTVEKILHETELNPSYLELEVNESTIMGNTESALKILNGLKALGVQIAIDHFGTGYTSISHLKQFPVSVVKIDSSFIKGVPTIPDDTIITSALIALAQKLNLEVVAEGVETAEQMQYLGQQNCDMVQGYFLSHPMPAEKIISQFNKLMEKVII